MEKYRVRDVARDFGLPAKVITEILDKYATAPKSNMQALEDHELSIVFEHLTQNNQVSSIAAIYADEPKKPEPPKPETPAPVKAEAPKAEAPKPEAPKPEAPKAPRQEKKQDKAPKERREPKAPKAPAQPKTYAPAEPGSTEEKIEVFIKGLLEHMDSKAVPHCWKEEGSTYKVDLVGDDLGYLIGRRGDTLDAIQHLANYTINRGVDGHIRINVDAECYREKREESLRRYARKKAQQVLKARRRTTLEPMNAYERHVIHAALQDMENITTHSTGVEPNRRVVIEYVK